MANPVDPYQREEDRRAGVEFIRMAPGTYDGEPSDVTLTEWLHRIEVAFDVCHVEPHLWIILASAQLRGDALLWYRGRVQEENPIQGWATFCDELRATFIPIPLIVRPILGHDPQIWDRMEERRYAVLSDIWDSEPNESMIHYGRRFDRAMLPFIPLTRPFQEIVDLLWKGVPHRVRLFVNYPPVHQDIRAFIREIIEAEFEADRADAFMLGNDNEEGEDHLPNQIERDLLPPDDHIPIDIEEVPNLEFLDEDVIIASDDEDSDEDPEEFPFDENDEDDVQSQAHSDISSD